MLDHHDLSDDAVPDGRKLIGPPHAHRDAPCVDECYEPATPQPSGPGADEARFQSAAAQLVDPRGILANALARVMKADDMIIGGADLPDDVDAADLAFYRLASAFVLRGIAEAASNLNGAQVTVAADEQAANLPQTADWSGIFVDGGGQYAPPPDPARYVPQAVNGVRFEMTFGCIRLGVVGDRNWAFHPHAGFVDVTGGVNVDRGGVGDEPVFRLAGRIVSGTPDHILGITDDGISVTLPRGMVREFPDDQR